MNSIVRQKIGVAGLRPMGLLMLKKLITHGLLVSKYDIYVAEKTLVK